MKPTQNSPELQPQLPAEQAFPTLEESTGVTSPEVNTEGGERKAEKQVEKDVYDNQVAGSPASAGVTATSDEPSQLASGIASQSASTLAADDLDVIEKAWVDRAKQIIKETRDDPRAQEEAFEKLQIEYHKKRYGRDIKSAR